MELRAKNPYIKKRAKTHLCIQIKMKRTKLTGQEDSKL